MSNEEQNNPSPAERTPAEVWLEIFDHVPSSTDLSGIAASCKRFRDLSIRARHRDLVWRVPEQVAADLPVWAAHPNMEPHVRSIVLGVTQSRVGPGDIVNLDRLLSLSNTPYASPQLHAAMFGRLRQFTNIESLTLTDMSVQDMHFTLIHSLPRLRALAIVRCSFDVLNFDQLDHTKLPIKDLTMLSVRRFRSCHTGGPIVPEEHIPCSFSLCAAHGLKSLPIDPTADVFRGVFNAWDAQVRGWTIPRTLESVHVLKKSASTSSKWTQHSHPGLQGYVPAGNMFPDTHLYQFCVQARSLKTIVTPVFVPAQLTIAPEALPTGLGRFAAPLETAQLIAAVRDVQALGLIKCGVSAREGITALTNIAIFRRDLKMLLLDCKGWDGELVPAVKQLFRELRRLKIVFEGPGPTEVR